MKMLVIFCLLILLAGCSNQYNIGMQQPGQQATEPAKESDVNQLEQEITITISDKEFDKHYFKAKPGAVVKFVNNDNTHHQINFYRNARNQGTIRIVPGEAKTYTLKEPGHYKIISKWWYQARAEADVE